MCHRLSSAASPGIIAASPHGSHVVAAGAAANPSGSQRGHGVTVEAAAVSVPDGASQLLLRQPCLLFFLREEWTSSPDARHRLNCLHAPWQLCSSRCAASAASFPCCIFELRTLLCSLLPLCPSPSLVPAVSLASLLESLSGISGIVPLLHL